MRPLGAGGPKALSCAAVCHSHEVWEAFPAVVACSVAPVVLDVVLEFTCILPQPHPGL